MDAEAALTFASKVVPEGTSADAEPAILVRNRLGSQARTDTLTQPLPAPVGTDVCGQALKVQSQTFSTSHVDGSRPRFSSNDAYPRHAEEQQTLKNLGCF